MNTSFTMRSLGFVTVALLCAGPGFAQNSAAAADMSGTRGIAGYLNPTTGVFTPAARRAPAVDSDLAAASATTVTGTFKFVFAISIKSSIPTTDSISCNVSVRVYDRDFSSQVSYMEMKSQAATRSGSTASCTVSLPYAWYLSDPAGNTVSLDYGATTVPSGTSANIRSHNATLNPVAVPTSGATTTKNVSVTL